MEKRMVIGLSALVVLTIASGFYGFYLVHSFETVVGHVFTAFTPEDSISKTFVNGND
ncbi:hypothetical protein EV207_10592 [Scopulibacillus darangshiensis]|uniref:Uncharacterized protein n=1 Tax=Scopulibacillus darangshiensis TaxID=442528 RepID=A0A4R2P6S8_9BACL|nr:hypothetical protein [Scopulibacillus darangshiensis]TCP30563.1 hypothetical protein EV207_10592 [Scopulibacillus darangshiensis]